MGIEIDRGLLVGALVAAGYRVFAINPMSVDWYRDRRATSGANHHVLGDRGVEHSVWTKPVEQSLRNFEDAAPYGHILSIENDVLISGHLFGKGLVNRFAIRDYWHSCFAF